MRGVRAEVGVLRVGAVMHAGRRYVSDLVVRVSGE
jgi:hypothetical protein